MIIDETTEVNPRPRRSKSKVVIPPEGVTAKIRQNIDGKIANYEAVIEEIDDNENTEFDTEAESENLDMEFENEDEQPIAETPRIPKTQIESMFDNLRYAVEHDKVENSFYAKVLRMPDSMTSFRIPCSSQMDLGTFQFTTFDQFKFNSGIHRLNNQSGGFFNIRIYKLDQTPLVLYKRHQYRPAEPIDVGLLNYSVPDAVIESMEVINGRGQAQDNISNALLEFMRQTDQKFNTLMDEIRRPAQRSDIEQLVMQKAIENMMSPPQGNLNFQEQMMQIMAMPVMVEKLSNKMFPEPPPQTEPDMFDKVGKVLENPAVQQLGMRAIEVAGMIMNKAANPTPAPAPVENTPQPIAENIEEIESDMQIFIEDLLVQLESDEPLTAENPYLQVLSKDFPEYSKQVVGACKMMDFNTVQGMLFELTKDIKPWPFEPYFNTEESNATGQLVYNERGDKLLVRLQEFYNLARSSE